jgi:NitT/TauT family transport system substrate-binding protein
VLDRTAAAVITTRRSGIARLADLAGKRVASPAAEASRLLFPVFARANGIDPASIRWEDVQANLRDPLLAQGRVDAVTGFLFTTHFNLLAAGIAEAEIVSFPYAENGLDLYGSAVIARADWLERNAERASAFVRGSIAGLKALLADIPAGMEALKRREALFDTALEARRFAMVRDRSILTPDARRLGFGALTPERMRMVMAANAEAYGLAGVPAPETLFTDRFLPPQAERMPA